MRSTWFIRAARAGVALAFAATVVGVAAAAAVPAPERPRTRRAFNLFAVTNAVLDVNRVFCGINNLGEICVDPTNSPVLGGGFWPKGSPDQYIFNSGLQIAGRVDPDAGFAWAGDITGAFFFDARGTQVQGDAVTLVYNSLNLADAASWPNGAYVRDTALYDAVLIDRAREGAVLRNGSGIGVSQQDLWTRAWDGNPSLISGRTHPMGILVEERGLAWNFPTGNEDIIYFIFRFYNITASAPAAYNNSTIEPEIRAEIAAVGAQFQARNEAAFGITIPDGGYALQDLYAAFSMDPDVGDAGVNYSTAILPFSMGVAYKADFLEPDWYFPPDIFGEPFVPLPGFIGVKYLKSPVNPLTGQQVGLTMFSNTVNAATGFPDPVGVGQLYRYLSGTVDAGQGDNPCTVANPVTRRLCFLDQTARDTRFFQSSGPFRLGPGEAATIVVAYVHAAPLPHVQPYVDDDMKPGIPPSGAQLFAGDTLRTLERAAGWVSHADGNADSVISQDEAVTVPRSLLNKALVAQDVFNNKFLLPFAPEPPPFYLVPGENQVTVAWGKSTSETVQTGGGDPYFAVASRPYNIDPLTGDSSINTLYDPNFRQYDVEGYRIYRGRTTGQLELVAQFDYSGTVMADFTGGFAYTSDGDGDGRSECAPELGLQDDCPVTFSTAYPFVASVDQSLTGNVVQIPAGGRVELANGSVLILRGDTAVSGAGFPSLGDTGVPFVYVDRGVRNSFRYFYAVTAFDVNSLKSGPSSLESPRIVKPVTPRKPGANVRAPTLVQGVFGDGGVALDPTAEHPAIDPATGTFGGIIPPSNGGSMLLASAVLEALPPGDITVRVDSVSAGFVGGIGVASRLYLSLSAGGSTVPKAIELPQVNFAEPVDVTLPYRFDQPLVPYDSARARILGIQFTQDVRMPVTFTGQVPSMAQNSASVSVTAGRFGEANAASRYLAHSRWWDASAAEPPDPTIVGRPDSSRHAGRLTNVGRIWAPAAYRDSRVNLNLRGYGYAQTAWYPADFVVTWNADSSITVRDSTHRVTLPFGPNGGSGWGFVNLRALIAAGVTAGTDPATDINDGSGTPSMTALTYHHIYGTPPTCFPDWWVIPCAQLERTAQYQPIDFDMDGAGDANGIGVMINGEVFIMEMDAIPVAGTRWRFRAIGGTFTASCTPAIGEIMTDCSNYTFAPPAVRPAYVPGLSYTVQVQEQYTVDSMASGNLANVHTVPDPYYVTNALEQTANTKILKFVNVPQRAIIRIYSVSGILVQVITHNDPGGGGEVTWNLRNRNNQFVASGVYFYHVEGPDGQTKVGRFTVVNFAQ